MEADSLFMNTDFNYLKRHDVKTVQVSGTYNTGTVSHGLTYVPAIRTFFLVNGKMYFSKGNTSVGNDEGVTVFPRYTTSGINYTVSSDTAKTVKVYFVIYLDSIA